MTEVRLVRPLGADRVEQKECEAEAAGRAPDGQIEHRDSKQCTFIWREDELANALVLQASLVEVFSPRDVLIREA